LSAHDDLKDALVKNGYKQFCICTTTRMKYQRDRFIIDLDLVDCGDFTYTLGEVERLVNDQSKVNQAVSDILDFARQNQLVVGQVRGKVIEYLKQKRPRHYQVLLNKGVVKEF
jgi:adenylate cyclase class IV